MDLIHNYREDEDFYMFYYKTQFCPFNLTKHEPSKCVYAHNWQDYRRPPNAYSYQPIVPIFLLSLASTGKLRTISQYQTTQVDVKLGSHAICAMAGNSKSTIRLTTRRLSVKPRAAKRGLVQTTIRTKSEESYSQK